MRLVSSNRLWLVVALVATVGCGAKDETPSANSEQVADALGIPTYSDPIPLSDGSCYVQKLVPGGDPILQEHRYYYVHGNSIQAVRPELPFFKVVPLADGSAIGFYKKELWRLSGAVATEIKEQPESPKTSKLSVPPGGFYFALLQQERQLRVSETDVLQQQIDSYEDPVDEEPEFTRERD